MELSGSTITFCAGGTVQSLGLCQGLLPCVVQNNNIRCFSHALAASHVSLHHFCCFFQTMRFKLWQVIFLLWFLTRSYIVNSTYTETNKFIPISTWMPPLIASNGQVVWHGKAQSAASCALAKQEVLSEVCCRCLCVGTQKDPGSLHMFSCNRQTAGCSQQSHNFSCRQGFLTWPAHLEGEGDECQ